MRITAIAPSMLRPTYAVSSAPQGTFGATTPVARLVAPAATETQRSGWQLPTRRQLSRLGVALAPFLLAACGEEAAISTHNIGIGRTENSIQIQNIGNIVNDAVKTTLLNQQEFTNKFLHPCPYNDIVPSSEEWRKLDAAEKVNCGLRWDQTQKNNPEYKRNYWNLVQVAAIQTHQENPPPEFGGACDLPGLKPWVSKAKQTVALHDNKPNLSAEEEFDLDRAKTGLFYVDNVLPVFDGIAAAVPEACGLARDAVASLGPVNRENAGNAFEKAYGIFGPTPNPPRWKNGIRQTLGIPSPTETFKF
jgi:hypothetical protein